MNSISLLLVLYGILYGVTMKIADLLDEHGLKWFRGADITFGFLWGIFGALIILSGTILSNIYLAMVIAFILRHKIDYLNHGIAATIMLIAFLTTQVFYFPIFIAFFIIFALFGLITDNVEDKAIPKNILLRFCKKFVDLRAQYYLFPFIYSIMTGNWNVFLVVGANMLSYEIMLRVGTKLVEQQRLKR